MTPANSPPLPTPPFRQVKASAGSGKTYALTLRFLELLVGMADCADGDGDDDSDNTTGRIACAGAVGLTARATWPEILAVTFTNKAASEMQERVIAALKKRALGQSTKATEPGHGLSPARAEALLLDILRHVNKLGIRTIDSLLNLLVRQFALDYGIRPDFETVFSATEALDELFARFFARCEAGGPEEAVFEQAVRTILEHEQKDGFWLGDALRKRLEEITVLLANSGGTFTTSQTQLADLLAVSFAEVQSALRALRELLEAEELACAKNFLNFLDKCDAAQLFTDPPKSAYLDKGSLDDCVLKASKGACSQQAERAFQTFCAAFAEHRLAHAILEPAYALAPCVEIGQNLLRELNALQREKGFLFGAQMAGIVGELLENGDGVPDAFCRLGERMHHLLVDEFQDTSRDQWRAALPLALECLSKGGSLFYVGDVKQAIYGWRGGDARLFDEVAEDDELLAVSGGLSRETLPRNWRSSPAIIGFNNELFGRLAQPEVAHGLALAVLPEAPAQVVGDFERALVATFEGSGQEVPPADPARPKPEGLVQVRLLPSGKAAEVLEQSLDALVDTIRNTIAPRRRLGDVAVLVRTNIHADAVCDRLVREGIPIITENSLQLARHPLVRQLVALLRVLDSPPDDVAFFEFISGRELFLPESGLTREQLYDWASTERKSGPRGSLLGRFREEFPEVHNRLLRPFLVQSGLMRPYDLVQAALDTFQTTLRHPEAALYVRRFLEVVHLAETQGAGSVARFLEFWDEAGAEEKVPLPEAADAVRILTIHKSKGLQFPVVIVPFHNWSVGKAAEYRPYAIHGHTVLTRLTKNIGEPYYKRQADLALEQVNLLYVAWTRAEEELYAFVPDVQGKTTMGPMPVILGEILHAPAEDAEVLRGSPPEPRGAQGAQVPLPQESCTPGPAPECYQPDAIAPLESPPEFLGWLPRLRVYRHTLDDASFDQRTRGKLAHKAVELLRCGAGDPGAQSPEGDRIIADQHAAGRAATLALAEFPELRSLPRETREGLRAEVTDMLLWVLGRPEIRPHLGAGQGELTLLAEDGGFLRPDLLAFHKHGATVLEFKTGAASPDHAKQLRGYLRLVQALFAAGKTPGATATGALVYLDRRVIEPVAIEPVALKTGGAA